MVMGFLPEMWVPPGGWSLVSGPRRLVPDPGGDLWIQPVPNGVEPGGSDKIQVTGWWTAPEPSGPRQITVLIPRELASREVRDLVDTVVSRTLADVARWATPG